jgi:hypothetical protein
MNHWEFLSLLCTYREVVDEGFRLGRLGAVPPELEEIGLFLKIGDHYYLNSAYTQLVQTLLSQADFSYIVEGFERETALIRLLLERWRRDPIPSRLQRLSDQLVALFQGLKNRDRRLAGLVQRLEEELQLELDLLIEEATRILEEIEESMETNREIAHLFSELKEIPQLSQLIWNMEGELIALNRNIDGYLVRLREFIAQTRRKREFNQRLQRVATAILNDSPVVERFLRSLDPLFITPLRFVPDLGIVNFKRVEKIVGELYLPRPVSDRPVSSSPKTEPVQLIDPEEVAERVQGCEDLYLAILEELASKLPPSRLPSHALQLFVYILNHYDSQLVYTDRFNSHNIRVVKWR